MAVAGMLMAASSLASLRLQSFRNPNSWLQPALRFQGAAGKAADEKAAINVPTKAIEAFGGFLSVELQPAKRASQRSVLDFACPWRDAAARARVRVPSRRMARSRLDRCRGSCLSDELPQFTPGNAGWEGEREGVGLAPPHTGRCRSSRQAM